MYRPTTHITQSHSCCWCCRIICARYIQCMIKPPGQCELWYYGYHSVCIGVSKCSSSYSTIPIVEYPDKVPNGPQSSPIITNSHQQSPIVTNSSQQSPIVANSRQQSPIVANSRQQSPIVTNSRQQFPIVPNSTNSSQQYKVLLGTIGDYMSNIVLYIRYSTIPQIQYYIPDIVLYSKYNTILQI